MKKVLWIGIPTLLLAVALAATKVSFLQGSPGSGGARGRTAPEFTGIARWINSEPLQMRALRGAVVWIDFWTYSCINCIRELASVREFYARYHPFGLEIVGVHSPEFTFEKREANVRAAVARYRIPYPVAMDNEMATWRAYGNLYWPRVYLVDREGVIRYDRAGEGGADATERALRKLLGGRLPPPLDLEENRPNASITPEIYAGYERGSAQASLANAEGYRPGEVTDYTPPSREELNAAGDRGAFFLEGRWRAEREYVEAAEDGARVVLPFRARDVFVVAAAAAPDARVTLVLDGRPMPVGSLGADAPGGAVRVVRDDLYRLVHLSSVERHVLTLQASSGFRLFTFTFG